MSIEFEEYVENLNLRLMKLSNFKEKSKKKKFFLNLTFSVLTAIWHCGAKWHTFSAKPMDEIDFFRCFSLEKNIRLPISGTSICLKQVILT